MALSHSVSEIKLTESQQKAAELIVHFAKERTAYSNTIDLIKDYFENIEKPDVPRELVEIFEECKRKKAAFFYHRKRAQIAFAFHVAKSFPKEMPAATLSDQLRESYHHIGRSGVRPEAIIRKFYKQNSIISEELKLELAQLDKHPPKKKVGPRGILILKFFAYELSPPFPKLKHVLSSSSVPKKQKLDKGVERPLNLNVEDPEVERKQAPLDDKDDLAPVLNAQRTVVEIHQNLSALVSEVSQKQKQCDSLRKQIGLLSARPAASLPSFGMFAGNVSELGSGFSQKTVEITDSEEKENKNPQPAPSRKRKLPPPYSYNLTASQQLEHLQELEAKRNIEIEVNKLESNKLDAELRSLEQELASKKSQQISHYGAGSPRFHTEIMREESAWEQSSPMQACPLASQKI